MMNQETATSASGVTTETQPVDPGSNPNKRKRETTFEEDLAQLDKMKGEYMELCRVMKEKYSKVVEEELDKDFGYSYHKDLLSRYPLNVEEAAEIVENYGWEITRA